MTQVVQQDIEYVDVRSSQDHHEPTSFYEKWVEQSSAKHASPELIAADALRKLYPGHSLVVSNDHRLTNLFELPDIRIHPPDSQEARLEQVSNVTFRPIPAHIGSQLAGSLVDHPIVGSYKLTWNNFDFVVHIAKFQNANHVNTVYLILHDGPEQHVRDFVLAACLYTEQTHDEIWVFNGGFWYKDEALWLGIKDSSWNDVVMKEESKTALQKDIHGFFKSEKTYRKLSIPWKRGLILYGAPGNGKTISIKAIMKTCLERGFTPLYVKSFQSSQGEEAAMQDIFLKTRQLTPCVLVLEDLDSLINDRNRSFFLNQLDGLEGNDGLLVIASTNHFDRLDPGLSNRPSRFDRKYLFNDPDYEERMLYCKYWQRKLEDNDEISFPESLVKEAADLTQGFSFAYLKEAFVSTLVRITSADEDEWIEFPVMLKNQIMTLREELGEHVPHPTIGQLEKEPDEGVSHVKRDSTTSQENTLSRRSRGLVQLPSPTDVSPAVILDNSTSPLNAQASPKRTTNSSKSRATGKVSETPLLQGCVLHAPPSAYPQVMPGSLPSSTRQQAVLSQHPIYWREALAGSSGTDIKRTSADNQSLIETYNIEAP